MFIITSWPFPGLVKNLFYCWVIFCTRIVKRKIIFQLYFCFFSTLKTSLVTFTDSFSPLSVLAHSTKQHVYWISWRHVLKTSLVTVTDSLSPLSVLAHSVKHHVYWISWRHVLKTSLVTVTDSLLPFSVLAHSTKQHVYWISWRHVLWLSQDNKNQTARLSALSVVQWLAWLTQGYNDAKDFSTSSISVSRGKKDCFFRYLKLMN